MPKHPISPSDYLRNVVRQNKKDVISIQDLKTSLHGRGFGFLMLIFALPLAIPMPYIPGLTTFLSFPLLIFAVQMMFGADSPWLPKWLGKKSIKRSTLAFIVIKTSPLIKRMEKFIRPRFPSVIGETGTKVIGFLSLIFSLSISLPLPFTNLLPAIGVFVMAFGLLSKDGLTVLFGAILGIIGVAIAGSVLVLVVLGLMEVI